MEENLAIFEEALFTGSFSEDTIRSDLQNRKLMDTYSTMGSAGWQTNKLGDQKQFYKQELNQWIEGANTLTEVAQTHLPGDQALISRCEKCKKEANKLLAFVCSY